MKIEEFLEVIKPKKKRKKKKKKKRKKNLSKKQNQNQKINIQRKKNRRKLNINKNFNEIISPIIFKQIFCFIILNNFSIPFIFKFLSYFSYFKI